MKISELLVILLQADRDYGDIEVVLDDCEWGLTMTPSVVLGKVLKDSGSDLLYSDQMMQNIAAQQGEMTSTEYVQSLAQVWNESGEDFRSGWGSKEAFDEMHRVEYDRLSKLILDYVKAPFALAIKYP